MNVAIDPRWTFPEVLQASRDYYRGTGMQSTQWKLGVLRAWAVAVGRERARNGLQTYCAAYRTDAEAARALGISESALRKLWKYFVSVASAEPIGITLVFPRALSFPNKVLVEALLTTFLDHDAPGGRSSYETTEAGSAMVRLSGLPSNQLCRVADRLADFFWRPTPAIDVGPAVERALAPVVERALAPIVERAVQAAVPSAVAHAAAPLAVLQAQFGERISKALDDVYASVQRTEIKLSEEVVTALNRLETAVIEEKLDRSDWAYDAQAGKFVRKGAWAVTTGAAASALVELLKLAIP